MSNIKKPGQRVGQMTLVCPSSKMSPNGYLDYFWFRCDCGNLKRYRYDQARRNKTCGICDDFVASQVLKNNKEV